MQTVTFIISKDFTRHFSTNIKRKYASLNADKNQLLCSSRKEDRRSFLGIMTFGPPCICYFTFNMYVISRHVYLKVVEKIFELWAQMYTRGKNSCTVYFKKTPVEVGCLKKATTYSDSPWNSRSAWLVIFRLAHAYGRKSSSFLKNISIDKC